MGVSAETNDAMLAMNALTYKKPFPLAVASSTQWRVFRALRGDFAAGTTAFIDIAPGASFFDPAVSFLSFNVTIAHPTDQIANASGTWLGTINESVVRARTGLEASRSTVHGYGQNLYERYSYSSTYAATVGSGAGNNIPIVDTRQVQGYQVVIPLSSVNPFFTTPTLIPSQMGQLRLEITWAPAVEFLQWPGTPPVVIFNDLQVQVKTYDLADTALKRLSFIASQTGLVLPYVDRYLTRAELGVNSINTNSLKAASRGLYAFSAAGPTRSDPGVDNMSTSDYNGVDYFQYSLGSQFITAEPVVGPERGLIQANHAFGLWGRAKDNISNSIAAANFTGLGVTPYAVMACNLERSQVLAYNGMAVSSSRPLLLLGSTQAAAPKLYFYLCYLRLLYVFSDSNIAIKE